MSGTIGGLVTGVALLGLLDAVVSTQASAGRVGTFLSGVGTVVAHLSSPTVAAIPDLRPGANRNSVPVMNSAPSTGGATAPAPATATAPPPRLPPVAPAPAAPFIPA